MAINNNPSSWMRRAFSGVSEGVSLAISRAAGTAQADGTEAKAGSRLPTNEPYGATVWLAFAREVASELEAVGAESVRPKGCRYRLAIVNGTLVLAVKLPAGSRGVEHIVITSEIRQRILQLSGASADVTLDFGDDFKLTDDEGRAVADEGEFGNATRAVLVVLEGSSRGGVERIHIGDVFVGEQGKVSWVHREELPIQTSAQSHTGLISLERDPRPSFADGAVPEPKLDLVAEDGIAEKDAGVRQVDDAAEKGIERVEY